MKMRVLNVKQRGILVVAFPVVCQLIFVILLGFKLQEIRHYVMSETLSQEVIRRAYDMSNVVMKQVIFDYSLVEGGDFITPAEGQRQWLSMAAAAKALTDMLKADPDHKKTLKAFELSMAELSETVAGFKHMMTLPNFKELAKTYQGKLFEKVPSWNASMTGIIEVEEAKVVADADAIQKSINALIGIVFLFACLNIIFALMLGFYFAFMVSNPLAHVRNNGKRLSQRQPLLPVLKNAAEFSKLDELVHAAADALDDAIAQNKELVANAADLIISVSEQGDILSINPFSEKLLGSTPEALTGQPVHSLTVPEQSFLADENLRKVIESRKPETFELQLRSAGGNIIDTRWSCLWSEPHKKMFCVVHDISEQKRVEQLKEDFANMISHDLRSPLMAMHNSLSLIHAGIKGQIGDDVKSDVSRAVSNLDLLMQLVDDLLDFQKLKAGRMDVDREILDFTAVASEVKELLADFAEKKKLNLVVPEQSMRVSADRRMLLQVLTNLVSNAIKFSPEGETITITAKQLDDNFEFCVRDQGKGIPEENRERVFESFEQSSKADAKEGTGLGLAICKLIVEAHSGKIWIESGDNGKGSTFRVFIPEADS
jgi:PAS domain S-box-containing protein